jgi:hypothetical protein
MRTAATTTRPPPRTSDADDDDKSKIRHLEFFWFQIFSSKKFNFFRVKDFFWWFYFSNLIE